MNSVSSGSPLFPERSVSPAGSEASTGSLRSAESIHSVRSVTSTSSSIFSRIGSAFMSAIATPPASRDISPVSSRAESPIYAATPTLISTKPGETKGKSMAFDAMPSTATTLEEYQLKASRLFPEPGSSLVIPVPLEDSIKEATEDLAIKQIAKDWARETIIQIGTEVIPSKALAMATGHPVGTLEEQKAFVRSWLHARLPDDAQRNRVLSSLNQSILSIGQNITSTIFDRVALPKTIESTYFDGTTQATIEDLNKALNMEPSLRRGVTMATQAIDLPIKITYDPATHAFDAETYIKVGHPDLSRYEPTHERLLNPFSGSSGMESLFRTKLTIADIREGKSQVIFERLS